MLKITKNKATSIYTPKDHCIVSFDYEERDFSFGYTSDKWKTCTGYSFNKLNENRPVVLPRITEIERDELIKAGFKEIKII